MRLSLFSLILLFSFSAFSLTFSNAAPDTYWNHVVQIKTEGVDRDGTEVPSYCNGTLLSPKLIVTAAHCLVHAEVLKSFTVQVEVGAYKFMTRPDGQLARIGYVTKLKKSLPAQFYFTSAVKRKIASAKLKTQPGPGEDIALIDLSENLQLESDFVFAQIISNKDFQGSKNIITQYKPTVLSINFIEEMSTDTKRSAELNQLTWNSARYFTSKSNSRVQAGDSGSPLFARIGASWKVIGVVKGLASTFFSDWDVYASVDSNLCEISLSLSPENKALICH